MSTLFIIIQRPKPSLPRRFGFLSRLRRGCCSTVCLQLTCLPAEGAVESAVCIRGAFACECGFPLRTSYGVLYLRLREKRGRKKKYLLVVDTERILEGVYQSGELRGFAGWGQNKPQSGKGSDRCCWSLG